MVYHIVMWKTKEFNSPEEKNSRLKQLCTALESLTSYIPQVNKINAHINAPEAPGSNYDLLLSSSFASWDDLEIYQNHPEHVKVATLVKENVVQRACVDYEI